MQDFKDKKKSGVFAIPGYGEVHGNLTLEGRNTSLELNSKEYFNIRSVNDGFLLGTLHDQTRVSLIDCVTSGTGSGSRNADRYHFARVFPHFVILGDTHISSAQESIASVHFVIDDAATLFYDFDAFGMALKNRADVVENIIKGDAEIHSRDIPVGPYPEIFYFTGKTEIFRVDTVLGIISANHRISHRFPGPTGIYLKNRIVVSVDFPKPSNISKSIESVLTLLRFFEVIVGRPQNVSDLNFHLKSSTEHPVILDVYWCMPPKRSDESSKREPHPSDTLLDAAGEPDIFGKVLSRWLDRHSQWHDARIRFSSGFADQYQYGIDRLVGAANMFDILPASATPAPNPLSSEIIDAKSKCKEIFSKLPDGPERSSILGALGRLGKSSLKQKIRSRAKIVSDLIGGKFPDIDIVIDEAVNYRNYFVHGTEGKIKYSDYPDLLFFFTDTLEFIFAASDLIESGWDIGSWGRGGTVMSHPFCRYRVNYATALSELKTAIENSKNVDVIRWK